MSTDIKVPTLPESIADALVVTWHKQEGDPVKRDEVLVDIETDKVVLEVPASEDGVLGKIIEQEGTTVVAHQVIGSIKAGAVGQAADNTATAVAASAGAGVATTENVESVGQTSPAVRKLLSKYGFDAGDVRGTGHNGRLSVADVEAHATALKTTKSPANVTSTDGSKQTETIPVSMVSADITSGGLQGERTERRVPMSRMRARIAERLLDASQNTAMLTTFNEVNMQAFIELRKQFKDEFEKTHNIKLGFMSIFLKAATEALKRFPDVNASIDGDDVVYHDTVTLASLFHQIAGWWCRSCAILNS